MSESHSSLRHEQRMRTRLWTSTMRQRTIATRNQEAKAFLLHISILLLLVVNYADAKRKPRHTVSAKNRKRPKPPLIGIRGQVSVPAENKGGDESLRAVATDQATTALISRDNHPSTATQRSSSQLSGPRYRRLPGRPNGPSSHHIRHSPSTAAAQPRATGPSHHSHNQPRPGFSISPQKRSQQAPSSTAARPPKASHRKFPRVYIYEMPQTCQSTGPYSIERTFPAYLRRTPHYTWDITNADLYLVPVQTHCNPEDDQTYINRVLEETVKPLGHWEHYKHRHIWTFAHDHGFCGFGGRDLTGVAAIKDSIILSPWGLTHIEHDADFANFPIDLRSRPTDHEMEHSHPDPLPCHVPGKDIVVPPDLQIPAVEGGCKGPGPRDDQFLFFGSSGLPNRGMHYSHGVRQTLFMMFADQQAEKYPKFRIVEQGASPSDMHNARFCLAPTGGGYGNRLFLAVHHGCIPVIVQDDIAQPWEDDGLLDYSRFAVVLPQQNLHALPSILDEIERVPGRLKAMQEEVCRIAPYLSWEWNGVAGKAMETTMQVLASRLRNSTVVK